eukprot:9763312-Ditylum_brightwellii.AAC.1
MQSLNAAPSASSSSQNLDRIPLIPALESPPKKTGKTTTINEHKIKITFNVGLHEDIKPHKKFVSLLSLHVQHFPSLTLEEWGSTDRNRSQSITLGANLPFKQNFLEKYCPQERNKTQLVTQWLLISQATFYEIKRDLCIARHLEQYRIYMNLTNVKAKQLRIQGFFLFSHGTYSNRKRTHVELLHCLLMANFDPLNHHCEHNHRSNTQAVAFASDPTESRITKGKLYQLNNASNAERGNWPHTGHWIFVLFITEGQITDAHIANMF